MLLHKAELLGEVTECFFTVLEYLRIDGLLMRCLTPSSKPVSWWGLSSDY